MFCIKVKFYRVPVNFNDIELFTPIKKLFKKFLFILPNYKGLSCKIIRYLITGLLKIVKKFFSKKSQNFWLKGVVKAFLCNVLSQICHKMAFFDFHLFLFLFLVMQSSDKITNWFFFEEKIFLFFSFHFKIDFSFFVFAFP